MYTAKFQDQASVASVEATDSCDASMEMQEIICLVNAMEKHLFLSCHPLRRILWMAQINLSRAALEKKPFLITCNSCDKLKNDVMQGSMHTVDRRVVPRKSTMSDTQKNVENIKSCHGNTSCRNAVARIYNENCVQSICSSDVRSFNLELQQQVVADGAYLGERAHKIIKQTCSEDATQLDYSSSTFIRTSSDEQASSSPSLIPAETFGTKISSGLELKEIIPEIVLVKTAETFEFFGKELSRDPDNISLIQDEQQLKSSAPHSVEDSSAKQRSTGIYSTELVDKKILVDSSESECRIDSKASTLCPTKSSNDYMVLAEPSGLSQSVSELQGDDEPNLILLQQNYKHLEPFEEISSTENELLYVAHNPGESVPQIGMTL